MRNFCILTVPRYSPTPKYRVLEPSRKVTSACSFFHGVRDLRGVAGLIRFDLRWRRKIILPSQAVHAGTAVRAAAACMHSPPYNAMQLHASTNDGAVCTAYANVSAARKSPSAWNGAGAQMTPITEALCEGGQKLQNANLGRRLKYFR